MPDGSHAPAGAGNILSLLRDAINRDERGDALALLDRLNTEEVCDPSVNLANAVALLDVLIHRFERHPEKLCELFGGQLHSDVSTLYVIMELIEDAKAALDAPDEARTLTVHPYHETQE